MKRDDLIIIARSLVGTPFAHQGRTPGIAMDCVGVVVYLAKICGVQHDERDYPARFQDARLPKILAKHLEQIDPTESKPGDVLVFWERDPRLPIHCGIRTDHGLIHATERFSSVVEHRLVEPLVSRIHSAFRFPGLED